MIESIGFSLVSVEELLRHAGKVGAIIARARGWKPGHSSQEAKGWDARINSQFEATFKVFGRAKSLPSIFIKGQHVLSPEDRAVAEKEKVELQAQGYTNETHAMVINNPFWHDTPVNLEVETLDYASILALRHKPNMPPILSTCMVLLCSATREIIVQRRSDKVHTYKSTLHTFGGGYWPPIPNAKLRDDRHDLRATGVRELHEETKMSISMQEIPEMMFSKELDTGYIQLVFLGIDVSPEALKNVEDNWEGKTIRLGFDQLEEKLRDVTDWCPSGRGQVLSWLALGAPCAIPNPTFARRTPIALFDLLMN